jgi:hypothetical protein
MTALSLWSISCTTDDFGFSDSGDDGVSREINLDASSVFDAGQGEDAPVDAPAVADAEPADRQSVDAVTPDASPDLAARADLAVDRTPDLAPDVAPDGKPATNQPNGTPCGGTSVCKSGFCVDGVCCDKACNNGCQACSKHRTTEADGTCAAAMDKDLQPCGRACGTDDDGRSAVIEKLCSAGQCIVPLARRIIESCFDARDSCMFCDNGSGRCIKNTCAAGSCCCVAPSGSRACAATGTCKGASSCSP